MYYVTIKTKFKEHLAQHFFLFSQIDLFGLKLAQVITQSRWPEFFGSTESLKHLKKNNDKIQEAYFVQGTRF